MPGLAALLARNRQRSPAVFGLLTASTVAFTSTFPLRAAATPSCTWFRPTVSTDPIHWSHISLYQQKGGGFEPRDGSTPPNGFQRPAQHRANDLKSRASPGVA